MTDHKKLLDEASKELSEIISIAEERDFGQIKKKLESARNAVDEVRETTLTPEDMANKEKLEKLTGREVKVERLPLQKVEFTGFPLTAYEFDEHGWYGDPIRLENEQQLGNFLAGPMMDALFTDREIRITDGWDFLVYWVEHGVVKHNGLEKLKGEE